MHFNIRFVFEHLQQLAWKSYMLVKMVKFTLKIHLKQVAANCAILLPNF